MKKPFMFRTVRKNGEQFTVIIVQKESDTGLGLLCKSEICKNGELIKEAYFEKLDECISHVRTYFKFPIECSLFVFKFWLPALKHFKKGN